MSNPLVTVGIPFYNNQETLLDSIKSIFAQTFQDWELILVDDGSTDNSLQIANSIDDPRVKVVSDGCNRKLPARLNQIIEMAHGKYIARMDADDICWTSRIKKQLEVFKNDPDIDVVGTGIVYLDFYDYPLGHHFALSSHEEICREPNRTFGLCHASVLVKKSWYEKNLYDESVFLGQDFNLWLRTYQNSKFANVREPLHCYCLEKSFTLKRQFKAYRKCAKFLFNHHKNSGRFGAALTNWLKQYTKLGITALLFAAGLKKRLIARRFEQISPSQREAYMKEIEIIKNTELPLRS